MGRLLRERGARVAVAESCTGGLVAAKLTDVPGSSDYFLGGVVAYADAAKRALLGVPEALLAQHGAVSDPVARAMAEGVRARFGADLAVATTGISGPGGGSEAKPVGLVHVALADASGTHSDHFVFPLDRTRHRQLTAQVALDWIRRRLLGVALEGPTLHAAQVAQRAEGARRQEATTRRDGRQRRSALFWALELGAAARARAAGIAAALREQPGGDDVRWVREESLHVTLRFLGSVDPARVEDLAREVGLATRGVAPFSASLAGVAAVPVAAPAARGRARARAARRRSPRSPRGSSAAPWRRASRPRSARSAPT